MVSLWPWKADETASFEKTLSAVTSKISKASVTHNTLKTRSRRLKALWTLYTSLAYIFGLLILILVTGWQNWGTIEYGVVAASPLIIYSVRMGLDRYYAYRISSAQAYLDDLSSQRTTAIEKFKNATKYNSTQKLLEKYGASPPAATSTSVSTSKPAEGVSKRGTSGTAPKPVQRTGLPPPPTANIRRPEQTAPSSPSSVQANGSRSPIGRPDMLSTAEFAPNAFSPDPRDYSFSGAPSFSSAPTSRAAAQHHHTPRWYDRFLDVLLGEDENRAANRLALICSNCRLVNGQAPPGTLRLEDVGKWRCSECGAWNGVESEVTKMIKAVGGLEGAGENPAIKREGSVEVDRAASTVREMREKDKTKLDGTTDDADGDVAESESGGFNESVSGIEASESEREASELLSDDTESSDVLETPPARSTRSQSRKSKSK